MNSRFKHYTIQKQIGSVVA